MRAVRPREGREERRPSPGRSSFPETEFVQNDSLSFHETVCYNFTEDEMLSDMLSTKDKYLSLAQTKKGPAYLHGKKEEMKLPDKEN